MGNIWRAFKDDTLPENYFRIEVILLRSLGIELMKEETPLYSVFSKIFLFIIVVLYTATEIYEVYAQWGNLNIILAILTYLITHITGVIKTGLLYKNRKKIGGMLKSIHAAPFKPDGSRGEDEEGIVRDVIRKTEVQLVVYFLIISSGIFSAIVSSIESRLAGGPEVWIFPFTPTISVLDLMYTPAFELGCVTQTFCLTAFAVIIATTYVLLSSIMAHISVQLRILGNAFTKIPERAARLKRLDVGRERPLSFYVNQAMGESIDHHVDILELAREMERLCSVMILAIFIASIMLLCFLLYFSSMFPIGSAAFLLNFSYYWIVVFQIGQYCYWGNEVTLEAEKVANAAVWSNWMDAQLPVAKSVVLVVARSQIPLTITAGKFVPLSMATFMSIIKGSFSYFMILKQTQEERI